MGDYAHIATFVLVWLELWSRVDIIDRDLMRYQDAGDEEASARAYWDRAVKDAEDFDDLAARYWGEEAWEEAKHKH